MRAQMCVRHLQIIDVTKKQKTLKARNNSLQRRKKTTSNYFMHSFHFGAITPVTQKDTSEKREV